MTLRLATAFLMLLLLLPGAAPAQDGALPATEAREIRQVIEGQLAAFRRDDAPAAFAFASPDIQTKFHDPATFMDMVRTGYLPVYRPQEVEFRTLALHEGTPIQEVMVVGPDGQPVMALYFMEQQPDGSWRISACVLVKAPDETV
jgi:hypothetical protein